jgi:hypothetical protein
LDDFGGNVVQGLAEVSDEEAFSNPNPRDDDAADMHDLPVGHDPGHVNTNLRRLEDESEDRASATWLEGAETMGLPVEL